MSDHRELSNALSRWNEHIFGRNDEFTICDPRNAAETLEIAKNGGWPIIGRVVGNQQNLLYDRVLQAFDIGDSITLPPNRKALLQLHFYSNGATIERTNTLNEYLKLCPNVFKMLLNFENDGDTLKGLLKELDLGFANLENFKNDLELLAYFYSTQLEISTHQFGAEEQEAVARLANELKSNTHQRDLAFKHLKLLAYHILRDLADLAAHGAKWKLSEQFNGRKIKVKIIDDKDSFIADFTKTMGVLFPDLIITSSTKIPKTDQFTSNDFLGQDFILIDLEFDGRNDGISLIRQFTEKFRKLYGGKTWLKAPRLIVLTRSHSPLDVQLCLNHGAQGFVYKERSILVARDMVRIGLRKFDPLPRQSESGSPVESSNYRSLYKLPDFYQANLRETQLCDLRNDTHDHRSEALAREFVRRLPKADLHVHIGTSISLKMIGVMAQNTFGYLVASDEQHAVKIFELVRKVVMVAKSLSSDTGGDVAHPIVCLFAATVSIFSLHDNKRTADNLLECDSSPVDKTLDLLTEIAQCKKFELQAALVLEIVDPMEHISPEVWDCVWEELGAGGIEELRSYCSILSQTWQRSETKKEVTQTWIESANDSNATKKAINERISLAKNLQNNRVAADEELNVLVTHAQVFLEKLKSRGKSWGPSTELEFTLSNLVRVPSNEESESSLIRYLWGADLLGAEHLQYPENHLLAAWDLTDQSHQENIRYQELRCPPDGYCEAGLETKHALKTLRLSLDIAARGIGIKRDWWTRTGILITAKRHKTPEQVAELAKLTVSEYKYKPPGYDEAPFWWRPASVIGFDLAGKEKENEAKEIAILIQDIHKNCIPLTIHAGEAASAQSIWDAAYLLQANRIGHGLTLRKNQELLNHVITRKMCLEICPQSNRLTNAYDRKVSQKEYDGKEFRAHHPLRFYIDSEVDIVIGTDNRFLHESPSLTDEYLEAARLVGGLSKWEVLKLSKAGFRNALLPLEEIQQMLLEFDHNISDSYF